MFVSELWLSLSPDSMHIQNCPLNNSPHCLCFAHHKLTSWLKFSDRSFRIAAPSLWNKLPIILCSLSTEATHANPVPIPPLALSRQQFLKHLKTSFHSLIFLRRLLLSSLPSTFSTSHCPFLLILSSSQEYTSVSWFYGHYNLLVSIYLSVSLSVCLSVYLSIYVGHIHALRHWE